MGSLVEKWCRVRLHVDKRVVVNRYEKENVNAGDDGSNDRTV